MRFFLRSRRFKIICAVTAALLIVSIVIGIIGGTIAPHSSILGAIAQPFRSVATFISNEINDFSTKLNEGAALLEENNKLQDRIDELSSLGYNLGLETQNPDNLPLYENLGFKIISEQTGKSIEQVSADTNRDYWLNSEESVEYGLVSRIINSRKDLVK